MNPGLVYCSITGFGSGAGASLPGYDFVVQALGGLMSITGDPDGEPTKVGVALVDVLTGKDAAIGILAALQERDTLGPRPADRGEPALQPAGLAGQPGLGVPHDRGRPGGWATSTRPSRRTRRCGAPTG